MDPGELGPFVLLEPLARGGMGEVWLARRFGLKGIADVVVVKVTRADQRDERDARQRFLDETKIAMLLAHSCIARTVDAGRVQGLEYLALEAVDGISLVELDQRMRDRHEPLPDHVALYITACVLDGLSFAHTARHPITGAPLGVVHRDMSPHNVMVASDGSVKIIDFGVALSSLKEAHTEQGIVIGKMAYMSPEQARGDAIDARADVFAVGVLLYELVAGERYYPGMSADAVWRVAGGGQYQPPALPRLEDDLRRVLERALHPDPARRTQSAAAMRAEVSALLVMRGGAVRAARDLAALVHRHAAAEVARMARARVAAQQAHMPNEDTTTESIASSEGLAIEAALRARVDDPVTVRLETYAALPAMSVPTPMPATLRAPDPPTIDAPRTTERVGAPRSTRVPLSILAGATIVAALLGGLVLGTQRDGAPSDVGPPVAAADAGMPVDFSSDAGQRAPVAVVDAGSVAETRISDAGQEVRRSERELREARILRDVRVLQRCRENCARPWQPAPEAKITGADDELLKKMEIVIQRCRKECGR